MVDALSCLSPIRSRVCSKVRNFFSFTQTISSYEKSESNDDFLKVGRFFWVPLQYPIREKLTGLGQRCDIA